MNRRKFLALAGGGVIVAAGAGAYSVVSRQPSSALAPWANATENTYADPRKAALSYAILAPNPHNRQPWLIDLSQGDDVAVLKVDLDRLLPHTDPFNRQITIGLGCFLETMVMAAAENGYRVALDVFPEGEDAKSLDERIVARATFIKDSNVPTDPLFAHVFERRSLKEPYDLNRPVKNSVLAEVVKVGRHGTKVGSTNQPGDIEELRAMTREALRIEIYTPRTFKESVDLFRIGAREVDANPDGIDFTGLMFEALGAVGMMTREGTLDMEGTMFKEGEKAVMANVDTAMAYVWQVTDGNSRRDQIAAGRDWVRLNLAATGAGVGMQPLSQALQEYPEMQEIYEQTHRRFAPDGGTVQMLARLGYADTVPQSPRWPLEAKII